MNKQVAESLRKGFALTNKSWDIFLFGLLLSLPSFSSNFLGASPIKSTLEVLGYLLALIGLGYSMSIPIFLVAKQQGKSLQFGNLLSITLQSAKRLIIPGILLFFLLMILFIILFTLIVTIKYGGDIKAFSESASKASGEWNLWIMLFMSIFSLFSFVSIYFSLEKNGLFSAIKNSISFSFKHFNFVIALILISWINYSLSTLLSQTLSEQFDLIIQNVLYGYEGVLLTAASLIFYQSIVKKA